MARDYHRILLLFVDGVGLAPATETNPFHTAPTPSIDGLLGTSLTADALDGGRPVRFQRDGDPAVALTALDAALGVEGLPQSATGQTALFTGVNAPAALGRHVTAFPGARLKEILAEHSLLRRAAERGLKATFANPYTPGYFRRVEQGRQRNSASTLAVLAADLRFRDLDDLRAGRAVAWDVERDLFGSRTVKGGADVGPLERIDSREAGRHLGALAAEHDLTLYETFYTDLAGHRRWGIEPEEAVRRLDGLLGGVAEVLAEIDEPVTVVLTSDHGNLEDGQGTLHTRNPVPLLALGPAAGRFADLTRLDQVAGRILEVLGPPTHAELA